jgi:hypothetical protein
MDPRIRIRTKISWIRNTGLYLQFYFCTAVLLLLTYCIFGRITAMFHGAGRLPDRIICHRSDNMMILSNRGNLGKEDDFFKKVALLKAVTFVQVCRCMFTFIGNVRMYRTGVKKKIIFQCSEPIVSDYFSLILTCLSVEKKNLIHFTLFNLKLSNLLVKGSDQRENRRVWSKINTRYLVWGCGIGCSFDL